MLEFASTPLLPTCSAPLHRCSFQPDTLITSANLIALSYVQTGDFVRRPLCSTKAVRTLTTAMPESAHQDGGCIPSQRSSASALILFRCVTVPRYVGMHNARPPSDAQVMHTSFGLTRQPRALPFPSPSRRCEHSLIVLFPCVCTTAFDVSYLTTPRSCLTCICCGVPTTLVIHVTLSIASITCNRLATVVSGRYGDLRAGRAQGPFRQSS
jgi:hypothetical protein